MSIIDVIKKLDAFPKTIEDFRVKTTSGAIVSIISVILMTCLFLSELRYFLKTVSI